MMFVPLCMGDLDAKNAKRRFRKTYCASGRGSVVGSSGILPEQIATSSK